MMNLVLHMLRKYIDANQLLTKTKPILVVDRYEDKFQEADYFKEFAANLIPEYDFQMSVMKKNQSLNLLVANILTQSQPILSQNSFSHIIQFCTVAV